MMSHEPLGFPGKLLLAFGVVLALTLIVATGTVLLERSELATERSTPVTVRNASVDVQDDFLLEIGVDLSVPVPAAFKREK